MRSRLLIPQTLFPARPSHIVVFQNPPSPYFVG
jgi:hypothetical protein